MRWPCRTEFARILRVPRWVALIWNRRPEGTSAFLDDYHAMLRAHSPEFERVSVRDDSAARGMDVLFGGDGYRRFLLPNEQLLDPASFWGRLLSSSYVPMPGEPGHDEIRRRSTEIFDTYAENGTLRFPYETQIFLGTVE